MSQVWDVGDLFSIFGDGIVGMYLQVVSTPYNSPQGVTEGGLYPVISCEALRSGMLLAGVVHFIYIPWKSLDGSRYRYSLDKETRVRVYDKDFLDKRFWREGLYMLGDLV